jgi:tetratricopeptide (TPR) repeat protein
MFCSLAWAQQASLSWQEEARKCVEQHDWGAAMSIVDREMGRAPQDMDIRAWRARILAWSGRLMAAEDEYHVILASGRNDADDWMGLANVYSREGRREEAEQALQRALAIDPKRADLHAARGRALRADHNLGEAKLEFQKALNLDPTSLEARAGLLSLRSEPKHELLLGSDTDLLSFADANHDEAVTLKSQWTSRWRTTAAGAHYRRAGTDAEKFSASLTGKTFEGGALTVGGAMGHDYGVIPKCEAFFDYDQGWRLGQSRLLRGLEIAYGQHWYWYTTARILTANETTTLYLPYEWTWSLGLTGARSQFSGTETEWRPSGVTRIGFPIAGSDERRLGGNLFFAVGTESFAQVDQIGRFSSQTYGGGLRFQMTARQSVTGEAAYQKRTQDRSQTSFGLTYAIHF